MINRTKLVLISLLLLTSTLLGITIAEVVYHRDIASTGTVKTVGIDAYSDSQCHNVLTSISWGFVEPGQAPIQHIYLKNSGTFDCVLSEVDSNWSPGASGFFTVTWNLAVGQTLAPGASVDTIIILTVSNSVTGISSFSFTLTITGTATS